MLPADRGVAAGFTGFPAAGMFPQPTWNTRPGLRVFLGYSRPATPPLFLLSYPIKHGTCEGIGVLAQVGNYSL